MSADPFKAIVDALPDPAPPSSIERIVMARVAQVAAARPAAPARTPVIAESPRARDWRDAVAWMAVGAGLVLFFAAWIAGFAAWIAGQDASGALDRIATSPAAAAEVLARMPMNLPAIVGLSIGATLYVVGLFARNRTD